MQNFITSISVSESIHFVERRRELAYYKPVGPLEYLLRDRKGHPIMGLYESKLTGEPSFIIKALGANWLLHLEKASIDAFLEDRIGFEEILKNSKLSKLGHKKTGFLYKTLFKWWTSYFIVGKLSQQKKSVPYPNVFYFYQQIKLFKGWNG